jgi:branched-chain amino acid aminotransferase
METNIAVDCLAPPPTVDLRPDRIEFGRIFTPLWFQSWHRHGAWDGGSLSPLSNIALHPAALVLHYAQSIFEGLKAYKATDGSVNLFRAVENARRFNRSAARLSMPEVPEAFFLEAVRAMAAAHREWIPESPGSLYIRPALIATEPCIGVRSSSEFLFFILTLPTGAYFPQTAATGGTGAVRVFVSQKVGRAAPGGTGNVKASANYSITLQVITEAKHRGCAQVLFLDSRDHSLVEEMGGMNVFFEREGKLVTPAMTDTILPGITRDSIIQLAPRLGIPVEERRIPIEELVRDIQSGVVREAMACGTAAVVVGIESLVLEDGREIRVGNGQCGPVTLKLFEALTGLQYGVHPDPDGWVTKVL